LPNTEKLFKYDDVVSEIEHREDILQRLSAAETHCCELHQHIVEMKNDIKTLEEAKADLAGVMESTKLAKEVMDARLSSMNEFRESLRDQTKEFLTRVEYGSQQGALETRFLRMDEDIRGLRESRASLEGKASQLQQDVGAKASSSSLWLSVAIAIFSIVISIIGVFMGFL